MSELISGLIGTIIEQVISSVSEDEKMQVLANIQSTIEQNRFDDTKAKWIEAQEEWKYRRDDLLSGIAKGALGGLATLLTLADFRQVVGLGCPSNNLLLGIRVPPLNNHLRNLACS